MNASCAAAPPAVDEFQLAGLTPQPSNIVSVPRVADSPVAFECKCSQIIRLQGASGAETNSWLILGEVVGVHIARELLRDGIYDTAGSRTILRGGGPADYFEITPDQLFRMTRPSYP
jgi:flavin reductase (DIM6/NTAB) family NADH-FMN oxidoreductase RutF